MIENKVIIFNKNLPKKIIDNSVISLGSFYTMHKGHQKILNETLRIAKEQNLVPVCMILNEYDFMPSREFYSVDWRIKYLQEKGFEHIIVFDKTLSNFSIDGIDFVNYLINSFSAKILVAGKDFKFGKNRNYDLTKVENIIKTKKINLEKINNVKISSNILYETLKNNEFKIAKDILGRNYSFSGRVIHGEKIARKLGFPTANVEVGNNINILNDGVYLTYTKVKNKLYPSITSVGRKETFHKNWEKTYESHILNFNKDIYDIDVEVFLIKKIRDQKKFNSVDELINQIRKDKDYAITYFINE